MGIDEKVGISYVYNKEDEPVGRLVLDYELIIPARISESYPKTGKGQATS